jgi:tRNA A-37 threonylcarbamoyl transferase component Bud32
MKEINKEEFNVFLRNAKLLAYDGYGEKVFLTPDNKICKLFRCKRKISSARLYPYAQRFADNTARILELGIPSVKIIGVYRIPHLNRDAVIYHRMEGDTLRTVLEQEGKRKKELIAQTAKFISRLHKLGICFRSLHFGNILLLPDGQMGLIDVSNMKIFSHPLSVWKRIRNFKALLRYREDIENINNYGFKEFVDLYLRESKLSPGLFYFFLRLQRKHPARKMLFQED